MGSMTPSHRAEIPGLTPGPSPSRRAKPTVRDEDQEIALRLLPDGDVETIPLTLDILLHPSEEVHVPQNDAHSDDIYVLQQRLKRHVERRPDRRLFSDLELRWPKEREVSPDLTVVEGIEDPGRHRRSLDVAQEGCRVCTVIEVVTPTSRIQREKDEERNPPLFARQGVTDCVLIYPAEHRRAEDVPIVVHTLRGGVYVREKPDSEGRFLVRSLGVRLSVRRQKDGHEEILAEDAETGELLTTVEEEEERRMAEASKRRQAESRAEKAESRAEQAEAATEAAARSMAGALLSLLENRGLSLDDDGRRRILDCRDLGQLQRWIERSMEVAVVEDLWSVP